MTKSAKKNTGKGGKAKYSPNGLVAYPDYRVSPGDRVDLASVDAGLSEGYTRKRDVLKGLKTQRKRIQDLQAKLYAETGRGF